MVPLLNIALLLGADPNKPHPHTGILDPFTPGPPPALSASEAAGLKAGKPVQKSVEMPNGTGGRALAVFDIPAPPEVVWGCINDIKNYPRMVPGVAETEIYDSSSLGGGGKLTRAKYTLAMLGYRVSYYLDLKYEPRLNSMTFRLDYTRFSDVDDTTGYWHVAPLAGPEGAAHSRVSYMAAMMLRGWWPKSVTDFLLATTLGRATAWVGTEAAARQSAGGVTPSGPRCRMKWLPFPRRKCSPPPPPPPPPTPPTPLEALAASIDLELVGLSFGVAWLLMLCVVHLDGGQYGPGQPTG